MILHDAKWATLNTTKSGFIYSERKGRDSVAIFLTRNHGTEVLVRFQPLVADYEYYWGCPITGSMDHESEAPEQCAIREALEESGYVIEHAELLTKYIVGTQTNEQVYLFTADVTGIEPGPDMNEAMGESGFNEWCPLSDLLTEDCRYSGSLIAYSFLAKRAIAYALSSME